MKQTDKNYDAFVAEMKKVWGDDSHMIEWCVKDTTRVVMMTDGEIFVHFTKPHIDTDFPVGYSTCGQGQEYDDAIKTERYIQNHLEEVFIKDNMKRAGFDWSLNALNDDSNTLYLGIHYRGGEKLMDYVAVPEHVFLLEGYKFNGMFPSAHQAEDKALLIEALEAEKVAYEKRLKTYFKKYGHKCRTWLYWVDE